MRNLKEVCDAVIKIVPDSYAPKWALKNALYLTCEASAYTAPEQMRGYWMMATGALASGMKEAHDEKFEWAETVRKIWNAELDHREFLK